MSQEQAQDAMERWKQCGARWEGRAARKVRVASLGELLQASCDPDPNVRILACRLTGKLQSYDTVPALQRLLPDATQNQYIGSRQCEEREVI